jgi:hypothetical protein
MQVLSVMEEVIKYAAMVIAIVRTAEDCVRQISHYLEQVHVTVIIKAHVQAFFARVHSK